jgi:hypothetical protein
VSDQLQLDCNLNNDDTLFVFPSATEGQKMLVIATHCSSDAESIYLDRERVLRLRNYLNLWLEGMK